MVQNKINEVKRAIKKRTKDLKLKKASGKLSKADLYVCKGQYLKAIKKYKAAIELAKD